MRRTWLFTLACLLLLTFAAAPAHAARELPFAADADRTVTGLQGPHPGCPEGYIGEEAAYVGTATHLGRIELFELLCLAFGPQGIVFEVHGDLVAANGDHLTFRVDGAVVGEAMTSTGWVFTGGTGRFASATGQADETLIRDAGGNIVRVTTVGTISYDASNRSH